MLTNMESLAPTLPVPEEVIERRIYLIRGFKVMIDSDLADLYQVPTKALNQAVRRNPERFPADFMFQGRNLEVTDCDLGLVLAFSSMSSRSCIRLRVKAMTK
jgi:hypothetical protein